MQEEWQIADEPGPVRGRTVVDLIEARLSHGLMTTWLESSRGRTLALVSNGPRAMVMLLEHHEGDPGEHAIDPADIGSSGGFVLENGQVDEYPDHDTVPIRE